MRDNQEHSHIHLTQRRPAKGKERKGSHFKIEEFLFEPGLPFHIAFALRFESSKHIII
jgi:hypothetical protein